MTDPELGALQTLRLKGRATAKDVAAASGLDVAAAGELLAKLSSEGLTRTLGAGQALAPAGRERLVAMLDAERATVDPAAITAVYADFTAVNEDFKQLATDWQLKGDDEPNDHTDAAYDRAVLDRLPAIHARVTPVVRRGAELAPRLDRYAARLEAALERVRAGDHTWLLRPIIDSYHTVWFELHEELIGLAGLKREEEAAAGRAE